MGTTSVAKKNSRKTERLEVMIEPDFMAQVLAEADHYRQNLSVYVRQALIERMERDRRNRAAPPPQES